MSDTKNKDNNKDKKIIVPQFRKSSTEKSSKETNSRSVATRVEMLGMSISRNNKRGRIEKTRDNKKANGKPKFYLVDTFDASNPVDILKGEYGSERFENMNDRQVEQMIVKQASLISFEDKELPEQVYDESEVKEEFEKRGLQVSDDFRDSYDYTSKLRFHDAGRHNGMVSSILEKFSIFALGTEYPKLILDVNRSYPSKDMEKEELLKLSFNFVYFRIKNELERLDKVVNLRHVMFSTIINAKQYGRVCHLIQDDPNTRMPVSIKTLNSIRLGRVFTNQLDWNAVEGVQYLDFKKPQNIIFKENMIYTTNRNYHQSPNSYNYGYSDIEPVKYLVELNTIIDSMDLKQINKRNWSPLLIVKVTSDDQIAVQKLRDAYKRFTSVFSTLEHETQQIPVNHDGQFLIEERRANDVKIAEDMGMPILLLGKILPNANATASQVLQSFHNTTSKHIRMWIRQVFEKQWYGRNIIKIIEKINDEIRNNVKDPIVEEEREIFDRYIEKVKDKKKNEIKSLIRKSNLYSALQNVNPPIPEPAQTTTTVVRETDPKGKIVENQQDIITQKKQNPFESNDPVKNEEQKEQEDKEEIERQERKGERNTTDFDEEKEIGDNEIDKQKEQAPDMFGQSLALIDTIIDRKVEEQFKELIEDETKTLDRLIQFDKPEDLPIKVKLGFDKITFDTDLERSAYISGLLADQVIDLEKAQEELEYEDMIEKTKLANEANEILEEILLEMKVSVKSAPNGNTENEFGKPEKEEGDQDKTPPTEKSSEGGTTRNNKIADGFSNQGLKSIRNRRTSVRTDQTGSTT